MAAASPIIKVAALCGSLRKASYHRGLVNSAIQISKESVPGMKIDFVEIESLPFINTDLEVNGTFPPVVEAFRQKILEADSILFASPEYNYSMARYVNVTPRVKRATSDKHNTRVSEHRILPLPKESRIMAGIGRGHGRGAILLAVELVIDESEDTRIEGVGIPPSTPPTSNLKLACLLNFSKQLEVSLG